MPVFGMLARLRFVRGTALDIFGYSAERRQERQLISQYRDTIAALLPRVSAENLAQAAAIASIPEEIRGYGHVKQRHLEAAKEKERALLAAFGRLGEPLLPEAQDGKQQVA